MPRGRLTLRIYEQRYLDMVRHCLQDQSGFGVCLIAKPKVVGVPARVFPYGTLVEIIDWDRDEGGLLIATRGVKNFRTINTVANLNGLLLDVVEVELLPLALKIPITEEYSDMVEMLERALLNAGPLLEGTETNFTDCGWVGDRLIEVLPMSPEERNTVMVIDDPIKQLEALKEFIGHWQQ